MKGVYNQSAELLKKNTDKKTTNCFYSSLLYTGNTVTTRSQVILGEDDPSMDIIRHGEYRE